MSAKRKLGLLVIALTTIIFFNGCRKEKIPTGKFQGGAVALTFDDHFVDNWFTYLPLLDSLQIKATFYVSHYQHFTNEQKAKLRTLEAHGHEIAFHTATHPDMVKEVKRKGMAVVMRDQVEKNLRMMRRDGFTIENFAYPFGAYDECLNTSLLRMFKSVRCVTNKSNYIRGFVSEAGEQQVYFGVPVDMNAAINEGQLGDFIKSAKDHNDCLILFAHQIEKPNAPYNISVDRIRFIAKEASSRNIKFVRIKDIQ